MDHVKLDLIQWELMCPERRDANYAIQIWFVLTHVTLVDRLNIQSVRNSVSQGHRRCRAWIKPIIGASPVAWSFLYDALHKRSVGYCYTRRLRTVTHIKVVTYVTGLVCICWASGDWVRALLRSGHSKRILLEKVCDHLTCGKYV